MKSEKNGVLSMGNVYDGAFRTIVNAKAACLMGG